MKKQIKKITAVICALACITSVMSGCGTKKATSDEKITLTLWNKPGKDTLQEDIDIYNEQMEILRAKFPDINFESVLSPAGSDYRQEYDKALMANKAPAFTAIFSYTDIPARIENGTIADITKYVENWELKKEGKIIETFDDAITKDGKWYALPFKAYTKGNLCNLKRLEQAGISKEEIPKTWSEFGELGAKITDISIPRFGYSLIGMDWCAWPFTAWVWSAGGEMVEKNDDGTYKIRFNEEAGVDTAMFMNEMIWKYKMTQKDILIDYGSIVQTAMDGSSYFSFLALGDLDKNKLGDYGLDFYDYIDTPIPSKDGTNGGSALAGGEVLTFNPTLSEAELEAAFKVAEFMCYSDEMMQMEYDNMVKYNKVNVMVPGRADWYERRLEASGVSEEQIKRLNELIKIAKPEPYCNHWSDVKTSLVAPLQEIYLTEGITREKVKELLDKCAEELYSLYPDTFKK